MDEASSGSIHPSGVSVLDRIRNQTHYTTNGHRWKPLLTPYVTGFAWVICIQRCISAMSSRYSLLGVIVSSWPIIYSSHTLIRKRRGSLNQCSLQPHLAGGTCLVQPGQWQVCFRLCRARRTCWTLSLTVGFSPSLGDLLTTIPLPVLEVFLFGACTEMGVVILLPIPRLGAYIVDRR